jgi:type II secretory pathway pseudopilin PulG
MRSCHCKHKYAFTLLEVVVGLTLMASVLVGSLLSFSAHYQQRRIADAKIAAVTVADQLLDELSGTREGIPAIGRGMIAGRPNWFWRTNVIGTAAPAEIPIRVIRLQVVEVNNEGRMLPLATVDLVEPIE